MAAAEWSNQSPEIMPLTLVSLDTLNLKDAVNCFDENKKMRERGEKFYLCPC